MLRKLADLGERTVDGLVTCREGAFTTFTRFLGFGMSCEIPKAFSLSAESIASLQENGSVGFPSLQQAPYLFLLVPFAWIVASYFISLGFLGFCEISLVFTGSEDWVSSGVGLCFACNSC